MVSILQANAAAKAEMPDLKLHSLQEHSHLVLKNEKQQPGKGHWALSQHTDNVNAMRGGEGLGGSARSSWGVK